jgi:MYXO-CTERM domain-containing protein
VVLIQGQQVKHKPQAIRNAIALLALAPLISHAALVSRNLDSDLSTAEAYYDTVLGITWMRDRNHLAMVSPSMVPTGYVDWSTADAAITAMNGNAAASYGFSGWRMPTAAGVATIGGPGCQQGVNGSTDCGSNVNTASSELAFMFHVNLGNLSSLDTSGALRPGAAGIHFGLAHDADFLNVETGRYWSSTDSYRLIFGVPQNGKVTFNFTDGTQGITVPLPATGGFTWLVHDGDIGSAVTATATVPEPSTWALAALALLGLAAARRRHTAT